jgi:hypothetical protein
MITPLYTHHRIFDNSRAMAGKRSNIARCSLSNGKRLFLAADGRSPQARLLRDREHELSAPLGDIAALKLSDRLKVQAAALLSVRIELARSEFARGERVTTDRDLAQISDALRQYLTELDAKEVSLRSP